MKPDADCLFVDGTRVAPYKVGVFTTAGLLCLI